MPYSIVHTIYRILMLLGHVVCHQLPERSPHFFGVKLPLCWRCSGIFIGSLSLLIWLFAVKRLPPWKMALSLALFMPLDVFTAAVGFWGGDNKLRFITGGLWGMFGTSLALFVLPYAIRRIHKASCLCLVEAGLFQKRRE